MAEIDEAESGLAGDLKLWLSEPANADRLREVGERLARFSGVLLSAEEFWGPYRWIDDVVPDEAHEVRPDTIAFHGVLIWGEGRGQWVEPIAGTIQLTADHHGIAAYELLIGDRSLGLKSVKYGAKRPRGWPHAVDWLVELRRSR
ncbi:hypothetical protein EDD27_4793 [Nonomuraea polychroma]|uniref:Uncharacterized protein n=1 Tax=Nonomuraea polychroma TaxID=46176 RepID=A0A438M8Y0_9ACTN|nr:hypothetical protein [Nonomuraea polychroma]RVX42173.1 hypothetical protein EDD27_4793 [Nonomuraea polychroma]